MNMIQTLFIRDKQNPLEHTNRKQLQNSHFPGLVFVEHYSSFQFPKESSRLYLYLASLWGPSHPRVMSGRRRTV